MEKGHEIRHLEGEEPVEFWVKYDSGQGTSEDKLDSVGV
jgi:hypothetical protein